MAVARRTRQSAIDVQSAHPHIRTSGSYVNPLQLHGSLHHLEPRPRPAIYSEHMAPLAIRPAPEAQAARRSSGVPVIEFDDVSKVYPGGHVGLERVGMKIARGEFAFLVGPTGCGKSTCLRLLMNDLEAT